MCAKSKSDIVAASRGWLLPHHGFRARHISRHFLRSATVSTPPFFLQTPTDQLLFQHIRICERHRILYRSLAFPYYIRRLQDLFQHLKEALGYSAFRSLSSRRPLVSIALSRFLYLLYHLLENTHNPQSIQISITEINSSWCVCLIE